MRKLTQTSSFNLSVFSRFSVPVQTYYLIFVTCSAPLPPENNVNSVLPLSHQPIYPYPPLFTDMHLIFFNYHNQHYISFRSPRSDATRNRARSALQISDRLSFFGQHMLKLLKLPMCPEEDRKDTSEPELDFRTGKQVS